MSEQKDNTATDLERKLYFQRKLNNITNKLYSAKDTIDTLLNLTGEIQSLFEADRMTIYVVDGLKKQIVSRVKTGDDIEEYRVDINNNSLSGYCAASGRLINVNNAYDENELKRIHPELKFNDSYDLKTGYKTKQVLSVPIIYNKKILLGVIEILNKLDGTYFTLEDQFSAMEIAKVLALAISNSQKLQQKQKTTKYDYLITNNIITHADMQKAMQKARKEDKSVESVLMKNYMVSKEDIGKSLASFYKTRFIQFDEEMVIPGQLLKGLKISFLKQNVFVPVSQSGNIVLVAMQNPDYLPARDTIKQIMPGVNLEFCVSLKEDIFQMIDYFFDVERTGLISDSGSIEELLGRLDMGEEEEYEETERVSEQDGAIVQLVNKMIIDGFNRKASDIHIEPRPGRANSVIRFRIDGACQVYQTIPYTFKKALVSRIKIMADLDISERRLPQDGKIKFRRFAPLDIDLRIATIPTAGGVEDVVLRILSAGEPIPLNQMGMNERDYNTFTEMISRPYGIVLVVGPTGSGKTTTLHSALKYINKPETKIWTAEDPVEITQDGLRQVQVHPKIGFNFAKAMRAFLRADPDVIMVGEMRDAETVSTGIEASLTGHLVFSTLHTNSAAETITRLLDMGMDPLNFADALLGVVAQRLVRTLCVVCKEEYHPDRKEYDSLVRYYNGDFDALGFPYTDDLKLFRAKGCSVCGNIGYRGRVALHEILEGTKEMQSKIASKSKLNELKEQAVKDWMTTLMQDGVRKIFLGQTDFIQVRKVCM
ncbi:MAG: GspE/PulE family protein [Desulfobacteraceae bacterium]|jgi:type II secretory ATPase GspE/PulE/Tfp pilus assembly ATPase PilB-like protein